MKSPRFTRASPTVYCAITWRFFILNLQSFGNQNSSTRFSKVFRA
nr:MAG TPA: hypothetical protein [Caudoviricetes sp.]